MMKFNCRFQSEINYGSPCWKKRDLNLNVFEKNFFFNYADILPHSNRSSTPLIYGNRFVSIIIVIIFPLLKPKQTKKRSSKEFSLIKLLKSTRTRFKQTNWSHVPCSTLTHNIFPISITLRTFIWANIHFIYIYQT